MSFIKEGKVSRKKKARVVRKIDVEHSRFDLVDSFAFSVQSRVKDFFFAKPSVPYRTVIENRKSNVRVQFFENTNQTDKIDQNDKPFDSR